MQNTPPTEIREDAKNPIRIEQASVEGKIDLPNSSVHSATCEHYALCFNATQVHF